MVNAAGNTFEMRDPVLIRFPGTADRGLLKIGMGISTQAGKELLRMAPPGTVLCVADPVLTTMPGFIAIIDAIKHEGFKVGLFTEVEPEPSCTVMDKVALLVRRQGVVAVVGIGGGSTLDTAKFAAILGRNQHGASELLHDSSLIKDSLPLVLMPTTSGTGSEISPYVVVSDNGRKLFITSDFVYANVALVDPVLTVSMPKKLTAYTGLDALTHAVEGMIGSDNPFTHALALQSVGLVFGNLPRAVADGSDLEARCNMSFASVLGMLAYMQGGGLYAHSISYVLTEARGFPHGLGCGLALPYTLKFNEAEITSILESLGRIVLPGAILPPAEVARSFMTLVKSLGVPSNLHEAGITVEELPAFASAVVSVYPRAKNPRVLTPALATALFDMMYDGSLKLI